MNIETVMSQNAPRGNRRLPVGRSDGAAGLCGGVLVASLTLRLPELHIVGGGPQADLDAIQADFRKAAFDFIGDQVKAPPAGGERELLLDPGHDLSPWVRRRFSFSYIEMGSPNVNSNLLTGTEMPHLLVIRSIDGQRLNAGLQRVQRLLRGAALDFSQPGACEFDPLFP